MKEVIVDYIPFEVSPQQINESMKKTMVDWLLKVYYKEQKLKSKWKSLSKRNFDERS